MGRPGRRSRRDPTSRARSSRPSHSASSWLGPEGSHGPRVERLGRRRGPALPAGEDIHVEVVDVAEGAADSPLGMADHEATGPRGPPAQAATGPRRTRAPPDRKPRREQPRPCRSDAGVGSARLRGPSRSVERTITSEPLRSDRRALFFILCK
jgi:hypothetical protein